MTAPDTSRWKTSLLYPTPDSPALEADLSALEEEAGRFRESLFEKITTMPAQGIVEALVWYDQFRARIARPLCYAHLLFAENSEDETHRALAQRCSELGNRLSQQLLFFDLELMELSDQQVDAVLALPAAAPYAHFLHGLRKFTPYTLKENEERLLTRKDLTGVNAFTKLFDELSSSMRYSMELDGETRDFTGEELLSLSHHPDPDVRFRAQTTFLMKHADAPHALVFNTVFNTMALDHGQEMSLRGYQSAIQPTNIGNELSDDAVEHLMAVTEEHYPLAQRYFAIKATLLGLKRLRNCDMYAPISTTKKEFSFDEARTMVVNAYTDYDPQFGAIVDAFFQEQRVDIYPRPGKSGGAFAMGISPQDPPYLLLNYTGTLRDIATIAHEAGHGLHFVLSQQQNCLNYHAPLPLAETASVFGEMLLTRRMLDDEQDPAVRKELLCGKIEDIIATTFRQTVLTRFEIRLHHERNQGLLSNERICELWLEENRKLYGDTVEMIPAYAWGWSYISHFIHSRFYCYSYTFAELLVLALYQQYRTRGDAFKPGYRALLTAGGSQSPADTARLAGIDIEASGFWKGGYDLLEQLINELESLI